MRYIFFLEKKKIRVQKMSEIEEKFQKSFEIEIFKTSSLIDEAFLEGLGYFPSDQDVSECLKNEPITQDFSDSEEEISDHEESFENVVQKTQETSKKVKPVRRCPRICNKSDSRRHVCNKEIYKRGICYYHFAKNYPFELRSATVRTKRR